MNTITINFIECDAAPENGYIVKWRVRGSGDPYTEEGPFFSTPAIFTDNINPPGTCYEGIMQSDCTPSGTSGSVLGSPIPWESDCESGGTTDYNIELTAPCAGAYSNYLITGGNAGDIVTVKAQYSGILARNSGFFTRADLAIDSPDGIYQEASSGCYSGFISIAPHNFSISVTTVITMTGPTSVINLKALANNSSATPNSVVLTITDINGVAHNIFLVGCHGSQVTEGGC